MGTRNLTFVYLDGNYKVAQYCQWDGYPSGQGMTVLKFLRDEMKRRIFKAKLKALKPISNEEVAKKYESLSITGEWMNMEQAGQFKARWPHLDRDHGANILKTIQDSPNGLEVYLDMKFAADSLFCEWAYVIDFDKNTFEVFEGFNKEPLSSRQRFSFLKKNEGEYSPIKLRKKWSLDALPTCKEFLAYFERNKKE